jgi:hypothetical protein
MGESLSVVLASPLGSLNKVDEGSLSLGPATGLQATVRVDDKKGVGEDVKHGLDTVLDFLTAWDTRRVDVIDTRADLVGVAVLLEGVEQLHVSLGGLDGDDIGVKALDGREDVVEVGVAEVGVDLELVGDTSGSELEGVDSPLEVGVPVSTTEGETFTDGWFIDLDGTDATCLEIDHLVTESKGKLLGLDLTGHIGARERPVEDGDGTSQHALHGGLGETLGVGAPLDSHWARTRDVGDNDGRTNVSETNFST